MVLQEVLGTTCKLSLIVGSQSKGKGTTFDRQARIALSLEID